MKKSHGFVAPLPSLMKGIETAPHTITTPTSSSDENMIELSTPGATASLLNHPHLLGKHVNPPSLNFPHPENNLIPKIKSVKWLRFHPFNTGRNQAMFNAAAAIKRKYGINKKKEIGKKKDKKREGKARKRLNEDFDDERENEENMVRLRKVNVPKKKPRLNDPPKKAKSRKRHIEDFDEREDEARLRKMNVPKKKSRMITPHPHVPKQKSRMITPPIVRRARKRHNEDFDETEDGGEIRLRKINIPKKKSRLIMYHDDRI